MATTYLTKSAFGSANQRLFTYSLWVKASSTTGGNLITFRESSTRYLRTFFENGKLCLKQAYDGSTEADTKTTALYRDPSGWMHIVIAVDTAQATSTNRVKMYVNGEQITSFSSSDFGAQNADLVTRTTCYIGQSGDGDNYFNGSMTHIHFIDGTAYSASDFGESDSVSGIWKPKTAPSVTYGSGGFFLKMENSGAMGTDSSGNSNTFTVSGTPTQNVDTPSNNFATMNPLDNYYAGSTFTTGNLSIATVTGNDTFNNSTLGYSTGKFYWETKATQVSTNNYDQIGITSKGSTASNNYMSSSLYSVVIKQDGNLWQNAGSGSGAVSGWSGSSWTTGDIIGIAHDATNNKIYVHKNGVYMNSGNPSTGANGITTTASSSTDTGVWLAGVGDEISSGTASQFALNFGQGYFGTTAVASAGTAPSEGGIFEYDCPSGYQALCTKGINSF